MSVKVFDRLAERYDAWFDTARGKALFRAEVECVRALLPGDLSGWVEVGVGTGRFAAALGVPEGLDPSAPMIEKAKQRGIRVRAGRAEELPYPSTSLDGILFVVTLCFLDDAAEAMRESARVLKPEGRVLVGIVPADSAWAELYRQKGEQGHPFYSVAQFYTCEETSLLASSAGFTLDRAASTLPMEPGKPPEHAPVLDGIVDGCGFVAMLFRKPAHAGTS